MELKISKIQWKKVLAFALTLCMTISMVQLPVNAEETTGTVSTPKHFNVTKLEYYEQTATFFDAAADGSRDALDVTSIEDVDKAYEVDPTTGYYDAKWFSFTPSENGRYIFKGEDIDNSVDSYGTLMEKDGETYHYIAENDDADDSQFAIKSTLQKGKTYYLCAGYWRKGSEKYNVKVSKMEDGKELKENERDTFSSEDTPKYYTFVPTESGYYNLKFSWDPDKNLQQEVGYTVEDQNGEPVDARDSYWSQDSKSGGRYIIKYLFEQGKTYYLSMNSFIFTDSDGSITISISRIPTEEIKEDQSVSFKTGLDGTRFKFTVNDTGWYNLKYSWDGEQDSVNITNDFDIRNESDEKSDCIEASSNRFYFVYLEKGKIYFLNQNIYEMDYNDGTAAPEFVNILISKAEFDNINTSQNGTVASGKKGKLFIFTPDKTGYYNIETSWDKEKLSEASLDGSYELYEEYTDEEDSGIDEIGEGSLDKAFKFQAREGRTYYLVVTEPVLHVWEEGDYCTKEGDILINISDLESKIDTITSEKPGAYVANLYDGSDSKIFKYTAGEDGYHKLSFDWDKKLTEKMSIDPYIRVTDKDANYITSIYDLDETEKFFMKKGETYYIRVYYINIAMNDEEDSPSENINISFKINMSQLPINEIDYGKSGNIKVNSESKIFKFTAQQDGKHVLICKWNGADIRMGAWNGKIVSAGEDSFVSSAKIVKEEDTYYRSVSCEKGQTYYIDLTELPFKSATTGERITDSVDVSVIMAYYNGKTDIDTIKNGTPVIPGEDNGSTDKPDSGNTDKPDSGNTAKPDGGNTGKPDSGNTAKPDNGNTNKPDSGNTAKPDNSNNNKPNNNTEKPNTGKPAKIKVSKIKISALSNKIAAGKKVKLTVAVAPANASNKAVKWTTSNKKVAVVSKNGVVKVNKKAGGKSVVLTAIAADGGVRATYKITVMKGAVKKVTITGKKVVKAGKKLKLKAKVVAGKKANKKLVWFSSNTKFATVNQKGVVKTTKAGKGKKVKITASATDGSNKKKVFTIKIK